MQTMASEWIEEGQLNEKRETILHLLQHRFSPNKEKIEQLTLRLAPISDASLLNKLWDLSLDASDLPEFMLKLQGMLAGKAASAVVDLVDTPERVESPVAER